MTPVEFVQIGLTAALIGGSIVIGLVSRRQPEKAGGVWIANVTFALTPAQAYMAGSALGVGPAALSFAQNAQAAALASAQLVNAINAGKLHGPAILEEGMTFNEVSGNGYAKASDALKAQMLYGFQVMKPPGFGSLSGS